MLTLSKLKIIKFKNSFQLYITLLGILKEFQSNNCTSFILFDSLNCISYNNSYYDQIINTLIKIKDQGGVIVACKLIKNYTTKKQNKEFYYTEIMNSNWRNNISRKLILNDHFKSCKFINYSTKSTDKIFKFKIIDSGIQFINNDESTTL